MARTHRCCSQLVSLPPPVLLHQLAVGPHPRNVTATTTAVLATCLQSVLPLLHPVFHRPPTDNQQAHGPHSAAVQPASHHPLALSLTRKARQKMRPKRALQSNIPLWARHCGVKGPRDVTQCASVVCTSGDLCFSVLGKGALCA